LSRPGGGPADQSKCFAKPLKFGLSRLNRKKKKKKKKRKKKKKEEREKNREWVFENQANKKQISI